MYDLIITSPLFAGLTPGRIQEFPSFSKFELSSHLFMAIKLKLSSQLVMTLKRVLCSQLSSLSPLV